MCTVFFVAGFSSSASNSPKGVASPITIVPPPAPVPVPPPIGVVLPKIESLGQQQQQQPAATVAAAGSSTSQDKGPSLIAQQMQAAQTSKYSIPHLLTKQLMVKKNT